MNYTVKTYNRANAWLISEHDFDSREEAEKAFLATGTGEGYWTELIVNKSVTIATTVDLVEAS